jgi:Flp pilus assembly protein TadB
MIYVFQSLIFAGAGILLTATIKWWTFAIGMAVIVVVFGLSGIWGYYSLKRERLIDMMKG